MAKIFFVNAIESPLDFNSNLNFKSDIGSLECGVRAELLYSKETDAVGVRIFFRVKKGEELVMSYRVTITYHIEGWNEIVKGKDPNNYREIEEVSSVVGASLGFVRGSIFVREKSTPVEGVYFPFIETSEVLKNLVVIEASPLRK